MTGQQQKPRTWAEQKQHEFEVRKEWLEELAAMNMSQSATARYVGMDRASFLRMAKSHGLQSHRFWERPDPDEVPEAVNDKLDQIKRDADRLRSEGHKTPMRAAAEKFGVRA